MNGFNRVIAVVFLLVEVLLFGMSQFGLTVYVDEVHYSCIVLCFLHGFHHFLVQTQKNKCIGILVLGLCFTCIGDYFLILKNQDYEAGVTAFLLTQICYFIFMAADFESFRLKKLVMLRVGFAAIGSVVSMCMIKQFSLLFVVVPFYAVFFIGNVIQAWVQYEAHPLFSLGLILFICCDICVGLSNGELAGLSIPFACTFQGLIWLFYIPSQICISFYIYQKGLEKTANI